MEFIILKILIKINYKIFYNIKFYFFIKRALERVQTEKIKKEALDMDAMEETLSLTAEKRYALDTANYDVYTNRTF